MKTSKATVVLAGVVAGTLLGACSSPPEDYVGQGSGDVTFTIEDGDSGRAIAENLQDAGVVATQRAFLAALNADPDANLVPGEYSLSREMKASLALDALLDPEARITETVTVPEGLSVARTLERLSVETGTPVSEYEAVLSELELPTWAGSDPEAVLYPATYEFGDADARGQLVMMRDRGTEAHSQLGLDDNALRRTLVLASLVQAEARSAEDMGMVAQVLENRLDDGQMLQLDSTVAYVSGSNQITTTDEERASDSPYNTYRFEGLPPGPINSPSDAAVQAVLSPTPGPWRYFVTVDPGTGETRFAETYDEHLENVAVFQAWLREN